MKKFFKFIKSLPKDYPQAYLFLLFLSAEVFFFIGQNFDLVRVAIHHPLDDAIPFIPIFIIPYAIWFLYVPVPMIYLCLTEKEAFKKQCLALFSGMIPAVIFFVVYPTMITFRPDVSEMPGILGFMFRMIFASDNPYNVCPSLHVFEAVIIHVSTFRFSHLKKNIPLHITSLVLMVLIVLSTVFVKQHSVTDVFYALILSAVTLTFTYGVMPVIKRKIGEKRKCSNKK